MLWSHKLPRTHEIAYVAVASVRLGQLWELYSAEADRWFPSTVTDLDGDYVTLRSQDRRWHRCHVADMQNRSRYRLVSDLVESW
jgi:hypothetical protein